MVRRLQLQHQGQRGRIPFFVSLFSLLRLVRARRRARRRITSMYDSRLFATVVLIFFSLGHELTVHCLVYDISHKCTVNQLFHTNRSRILHRSRKTETGKACDDVRRKTRYRITKRFGDSDAWQMRTFFALATASNTVRMMVTVVVVADNFNSLSLRLFWETRVHVSCLERLWILMFLSGCHDFSN